MYEMLGTEAGTTGKAQVDCVYNDNEDIDEDNKDEYWEQDDENYQL